MAKYTIIPLVAALVLAVLLNRTLSFLDPVLAWVLAVTAVTFLVYGYDKAIADSGRTRVPEMALLLFVLVGGTLGALAGMFVFKHKTRKRSFQAKLGGVLVVQALLLFAYFYWLR